VNLVLRPFRDSGVSGKGEQRRRRQTASDNYPAPSVSGSIVSDDDPRSIVVAGRAETQDGLVLAPLGRLSGYT
jgi:hypothetical protein